MEEKMKKIIDKLNYASEAYYEGTHEIMSNKEWDDLFDELKRLELETGIILPDSPTNSVGATTKKANKEKHEFLALSLDKTKSVEELIKWAGSRPVWMSWKLDGLTLVATYDDGKLTKLVTRGDGTYGTNITHLAPAIKNVPMTIPAKEHIVVRGEAVISYKDFNEYIENNGDNYENPRNLASGTLNVSGGSLKENLAKVKERNIQWIPFTPVYLGSRDSLPFWGEEDAKILASWGKRMNYLDSLGFKTVERMLIHPEQMQEAIDLFTDKVESGEMNIPVDGLVICYDDWIYSKTGSITGHHATRAGFAFKWEDESVKTTLTDIEWSVAKNVITPVAIFEPVRLEGTTVSRASLCNISECRRLGIGISSEIDVIKANKIIPKVVASTKGQLVIPNTCPVCGGRTSITCSNDTEFLICTNLDCKGKLLSKLTQFCGKYGADIDGMSKMTLKFLINKGWVNDCSDIYKLKSHQQEWEKEPGFGPLSVSNLLTEIENSRKITLANFLCALAIPYVGRTVSKDISKFVRYQPVEFITVLNTDPNLFSQIDGIGPSVVNSLKEYYASHHEFLEKLMTEFQFIIPEMPAADSSLSGMTFVITGSLNHFDNRDVLKAKIEDLGGKVAGSVSAKTNFLINNDINSTSGKNKKAKELSIPIITEDDFISKFLH